jgi:hypothetical protein
MKPDLMLDAVLLVHARANRNKRHSRPHALRLTLLVHFASENYPGIVRGLGDIRPKSVRSLADFYPGSVSVPDS